LEQNSQNEQSIKTGKPKRFFSESWTKIKSMKAKNWLDFFLNNIIIIVLIIFIIFTAIYGIYKATPIKVFEPSNIVNILQQSARNMFLALGVAGAIVLTGTDLSAGRILGFTAIFAAALLQEQPTVNPEYGYVEKVFKGITAFPVPVVILIVLCIGAILGIINGFFIAKFKLHPFIVTLATSFMIFAFANIIAKWGGGTTVQNTVPAYNAFSHYQVKIFGQGIGIYVFIAIFAIILTWFLWNYTTFGKHMFAVGANPEAANISGINVNLTIILVFMYAGIMYSFSGFLEGSIGAAANVNLGQGNETAAIAACVIGGISFSGGVGRISGAVIGVIMLTYLNYGLLTVLGLPLALTYVVQGALILFAVVLDMRKYIVKR